jgi:hypothetical protein
MKKIALFLVFFASMCNAGTQPPYYTYGTVHMMGSIPMLGIGLRTQKGSNGFDISANALPYFVQFSNFAFHLKGLYLFHPAGKGLYMGAGLGVLNEPELIRGISGSWEGTFGFEWQTRKGTMFFFEANAIGPFSASTFPVWPGLSFGYGF